VLKPNEVFDAG